MSAIARLSQCELLKENRNHIYGCRGGVHVFFFSWFGSMQMARNARKHISSWTTSMSSTTRSDRKKLSLIWRNTKTNSFRIDAVFVGLTAHLENAVISVRVASGEYVNWVTVAVVDRVILYICLCHTYDEDEAHAGRRRCTHILINTYVYWMWKVFKLNQISGYALLHRKWICSSR